MSSMEFENKFRISEELKLKIFIKQVILKLESFIDGKKRFELMIHNLVSPIPLVYIILFLQFHYFYGDGGTTILFIMKQLSFNWHYM